MGEGSLRGLVRARGAVAAKLAALAVLLGATALALQDGAGGAPPAYASDAQREALDEVARQMLGSRLASPDKAAAESLAEISRVLSDPGDQLLWLSDWLRRFSKDRKAEAAKALAGAIERRNRELESFQLLASVRADVRAAAESAVADARKPVIEPDTTKPSNDGRPNVEPAASIATLIDTAELADRLKADAAALPGLSSAEKFTLVARGASPAVLRPAGSAANWSPGWDLPRQSLGAILSALAQRSSLKALLAEQARLAAWKPETDLTSEASTAAQRTREVVSTILDRALGIAGPADAAKWKSLADQFEAADLWLWTATARLLEAADVPDETQRRDLAGAALQRWSSYSTVAGKSELDVLADWLKAIQQGQGTSPDGRMLLSAEIGRQRTAARLALEQQAYNAASAEAMFKLIQQAKAAELDRPPGAAALATMGVAELTQLARGDIGFTVVIEVLRVSATGKYIATGLERQRSNVVALAMQKDAASAGDAIRALLPAERTKEGRSRVVICLDGPIEPEWFAAEAELLRFQTAASSDWAAQRRETESWIVYAPSAAVFLNGMSDWTREQTLRLWRRRDTTNQGNWEPRSTLRNLRDAGPLLSIPQVDCLPWELGADRPTKSVFKEFHDDRRQKVQAVLPLVVRRDSP